MESMEIEIDQLSFSKGEEDLLSIPKWSIEGGEKYLLSGPTGGGKSTFAKWLAGWNPDYVKTSFTRGKIKGQFYSDEDSFLKDFDQKIRPLYLLQDAYTIFNPYQSVGRHFRDIWRHQKEASHFQNQEEIFQLLKNIGIDPSVSFLRRKINQVSQGEAQRLALILSMIRPSRLLILDEIFANVDKKFSESMMEVLTEWQHQVGASILFISHDIPFLTPHISTHYAIKNKRLTSLKISIPILSDRDKKSDPNKDYLFHIRQLKVFSPDNKKRKSEEVLWSMEEFYCRKGENVGLNGISGIGKSTFLLGLMGERQIRGSEFLIKGKKWNPGDESFRLPFDIRYLLQSVVSGFNPVKTIGTSLLEIRKARGVSQAEIEKIMDDFGLDDQLLQKYPEEVSGGEIQRFGVLSMLLGDPDLILFDESFSSVDSHTRNKIWKVVLQQQKDKNFAVIAVSHDVEWLESAMDRSIEIKK